MNQILPVLTKVNNKMVETILALQDTRLNSACYGGFIIPEKSFDEFAIDANCLDTLVSAYYNPDSAYYEEESLLGRALILLERMMCEQHLDGTLDLKETNFHDATLTGFIVQTLAYTYRLILTYSKRSEKEEAIQKKLFTFMKSCSKGLLEGGFHTPNHRWVMASALSLCWSLLGDDALKEMALRYLSEGIDCDENGEYTERSVGIYNVVNNRSLYIVAQELGCENLYAHISRNLRMVFTFIEPDDTLFTLNSTRQDNGVSLYPFAYFENYLLMAHKINDGQFAFMTNKLLTLMDGFAETLYFYDLYRMLGMGTCLTKVLLEKSLQRMTVKPVVIPEKYHKFYKDSGVVRNRNSNVTYTILAENSTFFVMQKGCCQMQVRYAASFFAKGIFISKTIIQEKDEYLLEYHSYGDYKRPFEIPPQTSVWSEMNHGSREIVHPANLFMKVYIKDTGDGVSMRFCCKGVDNVPSKIEVSFSAGGIYETEQDKIYTSDGMSVILKEGIAKYTLGLDKIIVKGGRADHSYTKNMRGTLQQHPDKFTIYMTMTGESEHEIKFE